MVILRSRYQPRHFAGQGLRPRWLYIPVVLTRDGISPLLLTVMFILIRQGDQDGDLTCYFKALRIRSSLAAEDPEDARALVGLSDICSRYERAPAGREQPLRQELERVTKR
jgi:hypothetical protein